MNNSENGILIIGDLMLDIYYKGAVTRISPEAPVPVFKKNTGEKLVPGGACNVAMNVIAAGNNATLFGVVGKDVNGKILKKILFDEGIDVTHIRRVKAETITKTRFLADSNQQLLRMDVEDVDDVRNKIDYEDLLADIENLLHEYRVVILSDYMKGLLEMSFTQEIIRLANKNSVKVLVDVKDSRYEKYKNAWLLKPNTKELYDLTKMSVESIEEVVSASRKLMASTGCEYVLTTCGAKGMVLLDKEVVYHFNTEGKTVYDVTGAGDTVIAYIASCLVRGYDIKHAVEVANYAAGIQVSKVGTASVSLQEVCEVMDRKESIHNKKKLRWKDLDSFTERVKGKKVVFTNGCFDILHIGHIRYLEEARKLGDILVVGVNSDESVRRLKGPDRPVNDERDRAEMLSALNSVDYVIVFEDDTPFELIGRIKPAVIVKGGDYKQEDVVGKEIVETYGGEVVIIPLVEGRSTTAVIEKIKE